MMGLHYTNAMPNSSASKILFASQQPLIFMVQCSFCQYCTNLSPVLEAHECYSSKVKVFKTEATELGRSNQSSITICAFGLSFRNQSGKIRNVTVPFSSEWVVLSKRNVNLCLGKEWARLLLRRRSPQSSARQCVNKNKGTSGTLTCACAAVASFVSNAVG